MKLLKSILLNLPQNEWGTIEEVTHLESQSRQLSKQERGWLLQDGPTLTFRGKKVPHSTQTTSYHSDHLILLDFVQENMQVVEFGFEYF